MHKMARLDHRTGVCGVIALVFRVGAAESAWDCMGHVFFRRTTFQNAAGRPATLRITSSATGTVGPAKLGNLQEQ